jgi:hypothetical protein
MLKKTLLALGVAWTGTAAAASAGLDDVTMNIVNENAFQEIISAQPAEIERLLQVTGDAQPVRTVVLHNMNVDLLNATPVNSQVLTVNKELNQGMVSFSFICAEGQDCQQRVQNLNMNGGFILNTPGAGINVLPNGIEIAPIDNASSGAIELLEAPSFTTAPIEIRSASAGSLPVIDAGWFEGNLPLGIGDFNAVTVSAFEGIPAGFDPVPLSVNAFGGEAIQVIEGASLLDNMVLTPAAGL